MKIWMIMEHPQEFFIALPIILDAPKNMVFGLIISKHKYWNTVEFSKYRNHFEEVFYFDQLTRVHKLKDIYQFIRLARKTKKDAQKLPIKQRDVLITFSHVNYVENIITTIFKNNKQIYVCRDFIYRFLGSKSLKDILLSKNFTIGKSDLFHYLVLEPLLGLKKRTLNYWIKYDKSHHDICYSKDIHEFYDAIFLVVSVFKENLAAEEIYYPYSLLLTGRKENKIRKKKVVFLMSALIQAKNFAQTYYEYTSKILQNLRFKFGKEYLLELRLHPNLKNVNQKIDTAGWVINNESKSGEEYIIDNANEIEFALSNISTILIFPLNLGVSSYSYHRCFEYHEIHSILRDHVFAYAPEKFFMKSLTDLPNRYENRLDIPQKVHQSLQKIYKKIIELSRP